MKLSSFRDVQLRPVLRVVVALVLLLAVALFTLIGVLTVTRGTPVSAVRTLDGGGRLPAVRDTLFARTMELYTGAELVPGNRVEVLLDGDGTYPAFWRDLRAAERTLTVQFYYSLPSAVADTLASILLERRRAGVQVLLLLDAFGSQPLQGDYVRRLRRGGVRVEWLRPLRWYTLHKADERSHVRAIIVDGRIGYTGGFGLADYWLGDGRSPGEWRETNVRFEGPAVAQLQAAFAVGWAEATGELLVGTEFFPPPSFEPAGDVRGMLLHTLPTSGSTPAERFLALSIAGARHTLYMSNSYFVPDDDFRDLLLRAAGRGVDVRILVPGPATDVKTTYYAARSRYEELLAGGVRIYEYQPSNMHAKTFVVDGMWSTIGSLNFDNRSIAFNNEATLVTLDGGVGARMDSVFLADLEYAKEITLEEFSRRPWRGKVLEWGANLISRVL
ncbi:MAG TPA: phospholipase D-like domain-containing protein [Gemmatimonadaceae bacterium]|nr:phospholipase D-like domain-containing protein [Gemmatimonadaceae bacterium]